MPRFIIFGGNGMLASAFRHNDFFSDYIAVDMPECDITDFERTEQFVKAHKPSYLINCAAFTDVTGAEQDYSTALAVNGEGVRNLARLSNIYDCKLIHFSTDFVFKGDKEIEYTEDMPTNPVNNYGLTKQIGEEHITLISPQSLIIRVSWLYGPNGKNFVSTISKLLRQQQQISVVFDQYGKTTYTIDAVEATKHLINSNATGIFHFANEGVCSRYEFTKKIYEILSKKEKINCAIQPIKSTEYVDPTPRPAYSVLNCQKYKFFTNETIRHWESALEEFLK